MLEADGEILKFEPWANPAAKPIVEFENVSKSFGGFAAVSDLSLKIYEREFFALLGPSGCGKTTLMRMLAGFEKPNSGRILLDGADVAPLPPNRRPFNMMFQSYALFPHLSIFDNIAFGLRRAGTSRDETQSRVEQMLGLVQLTGLGNRKPHQISGGQRQRVALARSLARRPKLLLLDEPLGALDKKLRKETQLELIDIQQKLGTTFVIVTHDQEEAMTMASRIAVMNHGKLVQVATPLDIYETPVSKYVASFIGDVNMLKGTAKRGSAKNYAFQHSESHTPLTAVSELQIAEGAVCWLAVRPEKINVSAKKMKDAPNAIEGSIQDIAYLGNITTYHVKTIAGQMMTAQVTNRGRDLALHFNAGQKVWLSWDHSSSILLKD